MWLIWLPRNFRNYPLSLCLSPHHWDYMCKQAIMPSFPWYSESDSGLYACTENTLLPKPSPQPQINIFVSIFLTSIVCCGLNIDNVSQLVSKYLASRVLRAAVDPWKAEPNEKPQVSGNVYLREWLDLSVFLPAYVVCLARIGALTNVFGQPCQRSTTQGQSDRRVKILEL